MTLFPEFPPQIPGSVIEGTELKQSSRANTVMFAQPLTHLARMLAPGIAPPIAFSYRLHFGPQLTSSY